MKLGHVQHVHFIGVGGSGMSGIAAVLLDLGYRVSGSDAKSSAVTEHLQRQGATVTIGHRADAVDDADVVVYSSAITTANPEMQAAEARRIPVIHRAEMLAELMRIKQGIAVAGAHGKTTTTSLIAHVLEKSGLDPTVIIGGKIKTHNANAKLGRGELLVAEADESDGSFLRLKPVIAVINNIDREHLEYWGTYENLQAANVEFANSVPFYGVVLLGQDDATLASLRTRIRRPVRTFGVDTAADIRAAELNIGQLTEFSVRIDGQDIGRCRLPLAGRHNVRNALAAIGVAQEVGVDPKQSISALADFPGIERRFEILFDGGPIVIDDYGHHPAEIAATIAAARARWQRPLTVVFQPHRYSRTEQLWQEFRAELLKPDRVRVTDVYAAGEPVRSAFESPQLAQEIHDAGHPDAAYLRFDELIATLSKSIDKEDVVLFLGAGNITGKAHEFAKTLA